MQMMLNSREILDETGHESSDISQLQEREPTMLFLCNI
jgi:hypothetical protein